MLKFLKNICLFIFISALVGEAIVRLTHPTSDIPQRVINKTNGIQKYKPMQEGYWKGGNHKWMINKLGWPGSLPDSYDNLIAIIGDSYIENFMNPNKCRQSIYLKENLNYNNFIEASRSGVTFIGAMEISKELDTLNPIQTLIYVNDNDFYESIKNIKSLTSVTQINLDNNKIIHGEMRSPRLKKILYNWKLLYYFYNRFPLNPNSNKTIKKNRILSSSDESMNTIFRLINYTKNNYNIDNKTLVFHPNSNENIIRLCQKLGFKTITLNSDNDTSWTFNHDPHWTCYGHRKVAEQVSRSIRLYDLPLEYRRENNE